MRGRVFYTLHRIKNYTRSGTERKLLDGTLGRYYCVCPFWTLENHSISPTRRRRECEGEENDFCLFCSSLDAIVQNHKSRAHANPPFERVHAEILALPP